MAEITVGELLMQCLHAEGVDMMAGIIDGAHIPVSYTHLTLPTSDLV